MKFNYCKRVLSLLLLIVSPLSFARDVGIQFIIESSLISSTPPVRTERDLRQTMDRWVVEMNGYYATSNVDIQIRLQNIVFRNIPDIAPDTVLDNMANQSNGFEGLFSLADEYGADYSVAVVKQASGWGGKGFRPETAVQLSNRAKRLSLIALNSGCDSACVAHEVGHNMGLNHGVYVKTCYAENTGDDVAFQSFALGWGRGDCILNNADTPWGDLMVGNYMWSKEGSTASHIVPFFSNPNISSAFFCKYGSSMACGDPSKGDASRALRENIAAYAALEEPDVHTLSYGSAAFSNCINQNYHGVEIPRCQDSCRVN